MADDKTLFEVNITEDDQTSSGKKQESVVSEILQKLNKGADQPFGQGRRGTRKASTSSSIFEKRDSTAWASSVLYPKSKVPLAPIGGGTVGLGGGGGGGGGRGGSSGGGMFIRNVNNIIVHNARSVKIVAQSVKVNADKQVSRERKGSGLLAGVGLGVTASTALKASGLSAAGVTAVGVALGGLGVAAATVTAGLLAMNNVMSNTVEELKGISATVAFASATAQRRTIQSQIAQGQRVGDELSDFIEARTDLSIEIRELKSDFIELFGPAVTVVIRAMSVIVDWINGQDESEETKIGLDEMMDFLTATDFMQKRRGRGRLGRGRNIVLPDPPGNNPQPE